MLDKEDYTGGTDGWTNEGTYALAWELCDNDDMYVDMTDLAQTVFERGTEHYGRLCDMAKCIESYVEDLDGLNDVNQEDPLKTMFENIGSWWEADFEEIAAGYLYDLEIGVVTSAWPPHAGSAPLDDESATEVGL
jgi:hypothetical protein